MPEGKFKTPEAGDAPAGVKSILKATYESCRTKWTKEHPGDMENEGNKTSCSKQAWGAVKNAGWHKDAQGNWIHTPSSNQLHVNFKNDTYEMREEVHQGKTFIVVPVTMMVEGVHDGSQGPLLHTMEDLGKFPDAWNKMPIVIDHPMNDGEFVSAGSPEVIDSVGVGNVYRTNVDGSRLKAEAWFDKDKLMEIAPEIYQNILDGKVLEVSVGVFTENEDLMTEGDWKGESYVAIARNHRPDHLAILTEGIGACSIDDGCGLGVNGGEGSGNFGHEGRPGEVGGSGGEGGIIKPFTMDMSNGYTSVDELKNTGLGKLEDTDLQKIANRWNALYDKYESAMERGADFSRSYLDGMNSLDKMITTKLTKIGVKVTSGEGDDTILEFNNRNKSIRNTLNHTTGGVYEKLDELRNLVSSFGTQTINQWLQEVYDTYLIYEVNEQRKGSCLYKQNYQMNVESREYELVGNPVEVEKQVTYINVNNNNNNFKKEVKMPKGKECGQCMEKIVAIIQSNKTPYTEAQREWLLTQEESFLDAIMPKDDVKPAEVTADQIINVMKSMKPEDRIKLLPDEDQNAISSFKRIQKEKRDNLIKAIQDNTSKELWPDDVLNVYTEDTLKRLFESVKKPEVIDYTVAGGGPVANIGEDKGMYPVDIKMEN